MSDTYLEIKWTISRGRDTYGYNIVTVIDSTTGKRYRAMGGGYDMTGAAFGEWLQDVAQDRLLAIKERAHRYNYANNCGDLYGMRWIDRTPHGEPERVTVDGACGLESMRTIAEAAGMSVRALVNRQGNVNGFIVTTEGDV